MNARRSLSRRRLASAALATVVLFGAALALVACGDSANPAPPKRTLTPSAIETAGKKGATTVPTASPTTTSTAKPTTKPTATPTPTRVTDASIKAAILARLAQEPGLQGFDIRVTVADRVVYLRARVRTKDQRSLIEQIALTEKGVKKVVSAIDVDDAAGY
jgi:osmotically-inducible protein OsmY